MYVCKYLCICVFVYVCMCSCVCVCMCVCVYHCQLTDAPAHVRTLMHWPCRGAGVRALSLLLLKALSLGNLPSRVLRAGPAGPLCCCLWCFVSAWRAHRTHQGRTDPMSSPRPRPADTIGLQVACARVYVCMCVCVYACTCVYVSMCLCMYECMYV